jgi:alpha-beta hydrolase superfamily lysophospholipase
MNLLVNTNSAKKASPITLPDLLIHGYQNDVITHDHSKRIFANLGAVKKQRIVAEMADMTTSGKGRNTKIISMILPIFR